MLEEYMKKHRLTQAQVARDTGLSQMQVHRILTGAEITERSALRLNRAYGFPLYKLRPETWAPPGERVGK